MDAILRIDAKTSGQPALERLSSSLRQIGPAAESSAAGVNRLSRMLDAAASMAAGIGLANLADRMLAFAGDALQAGDDALLVERRIANLGDQLGETAKLTSFAKEAAQRFTLSQLDASNAVADFYGRLRPMGISLEDVQSTFNGVNTTARRAGLSMLDAKEAARQLGQAMGSGRLQGDEFRAIMERMPAVGVAIVKVFNDIARSKGLVQITRQKADEMINEVKTGEKKQTEIMKNETRERERLAERETDSLLREISKRYDAMRRALDDSYDDMSDAESKARDERLNKEKSAIEERFDMERKAYERRHEDIKDQLVKDETLSDEQRKQVERRLEDEREMILDEIQKRQDAELKGVISVAEEQAKIRRREIRDQQREREDAIQEAQRWEEQSAKDSLDRQKQEMQSHLNEQIQANKKANEQIIASLSARVKVTQGDLKKMASEGLITPDILIKAMRELEKAQVIDSSPLQKFRAAMGNLTAEIGDNLLPVLTPFIEGLAKLINGFGKLPEPLQAVSLALGTIGVGIAALNVGRLLAAAKALASVGAAIPTRSMTDIYMGKNAPKPTRSMSDIYMGKNAPKPPKPPPGMFKSFLAEIAKVALALRGLTVEAGKFFLMFGAEMLRLTPSVGRLGTAFAGLRIGATIAGWLGAVAPFAAGFQAVMGGILAWVGSTFVPAMLAFFSGPAGWITLGVAAIIAGLVLFREPIGQFLRWIIKETYDFFVQPWIDLWNQVLEKPVKEFLGKLGNLFQNIGYLIDKFLVQPVKNIVNVLIDYGIVAPLLDAERAITNWAKGVVDKVMEDVNWLKTEILLFIDSGIIAPLIEVERDIKSRVKGLVDGITYLVNTYIVSPLNTAFQWIGERLAWIQEKIEMALKWIVDKVTALITKISKQLYSMTNLDPLIENWNKLWNQLTEKPEQFKNDVDKRFSDLQEKIVVTWRAIPAFLEGVWKNVTQGMARAWNWMVMGIYGSINDVIRLWNSVTSRINNISPIKFALIPEISPGFLVPEFAKGGFVQRPTLAMVGEGHNPREYVIPEDGMDAAAAGWHRGLRGDALVAAWQTPGLAPGRSTLHPVSRAPGGDTIAPTIRIEANSGPVFQMPDGSQWVSRAEYLSGLAATSRATIDAMTRINSGAAARARRRA